MLNLFLICCTSLYLSFFFSLSIYIEIDFSFEDIIYLTNISHIFFWGSKLASASICLSNFASNIQNPVDIILVMLTTLHLKEH